MHKLFKLYFLVIIIAFVLSGCYNSSFSSTNRSASTINSTPSNDDSSTLVTVTQSGITATTPIAPADKLEVNFIDVGQGDSELIRTPDNKTMLIDAGTNASTNSLISYLKSQKVKTINYLILSHPHEDHIGGADAVIKDFNVITVYMPKVTTTTKTFEDVLLAMKSKGVKASQPAQGTSFNLGEANCTVLGPINADQDDLNTYSIVIKLTYGKTSFLFTGDAQVSNEEDMISEGFDLTATVLKVGHHGSNTSTSQQFLDATNPKYAVISCGVGNDYGHPHQETIEKLQDAKISVYRTDESGTIVATSDGNNVSFNVKPGDYVKWDSTTSSSDIKSTTIPATHVAPATDISASLDNTSPTQDSRIHLTVTGPQGAYYTAVCHYKSKDTTYNGKVGSPLSINISRASKGYTVVIDITTTYNGKAYVTQTSFTPR